MTEGGLNIEALLQEMEQAEGLDEASVAITAVQLVDVWHLDMHQK